MRVRILCFASTLLAIGAGGLPISRAEGAEPAEVVILGTIHGTHQQNTGYSLEILRDLIVGLKPAAILIEAPPTVGGKPTVRDGRGLGIWGDKDEGWASNAAAEILHVPVIPYDRDRRNDFYLETRYFDRRKELSRRLSQWFGAAKVPAEGALVAAVFRDTGRSAEHLFRSTGPEVINSEGFDRVIRLKHFVYEEYMPALSEKLDALKDMAGEFAFFRDEWVERNRAMADHIVSQAKERPGRRVAVLCGAEHRYILRDLLQAEPAVRLKEYYEVSR